MKVRFWGVRGSIPTPISPAGIEAKIIQAITSLPPGFDPRKEEAVRQYVASLDPLVRGTAGGNTACVEVRGAETTVIIDAGSGLRELGLELMRGPCAAGRATLHLFISHPHWDHIQGFPFFAPAFIAGNRILIYSVHDLRAALTEQQRSLNFPIPLSYMRATLEFVPLEEGRPFTAGEFNVEILRNAHPGDAYSYRISDRRSTLVYASDAEYKDLDDTELAPCIKFFRNADAIVFDAQYTLKEAWQKVDWGHSSAMIGVHLARQAHARRLLLFHHDPTYSDQQLAQILEDARIYQEQDDTRPPVEIMIAYEGLSLDLTPAGTVDLQFLRDSQAAVLKPTSTFDERGVAQITRQISSLETLLALDSTIIDLAQVETLTVAGLKALVRLSYEHNSGPLVLVNPQPKVQEVIRLGGYSDFFTIYPSLEAALAASRLREDLKLPGHTLKGRYRIEERVGVNRLGTALRATDLLNGRKVAIIVLAPTFSAETLTRLLEQAPNLLALHHPIIRRVEAVEQEAGTTFIVLEWFERMQTLEERLAERPLQIEETLDLAINVARALSYLHSCNLVHGDLQANTVFFTEHGLKISNAGIGRLEEGRNLQGGPLLLLNAAYLAPEQIAGAPLKAASDLYALGVILYRLFTGRLPYTGNDQELMQAHLAGSVTPPRQVNPALSFGLEHLIMRLLARRPEERYTDVQQVANILSSLAISSGESHAQYLERLVEREDELALLEQCWRQACNGHGQLVLISGDTGIGKTSLAHEAARRIGAALVFSGRCRNLPPTPAYGPLIEILQAYLLVDPSELDDRQVRNDFAVLAHIAPALRDLQPDLGDTPALDPRREQLRLIHAIRRIIRMATRRRPWLVILDDLHWADSGTLEVLRYLGRCLSEVPMVLIATYRDSELSRDHALRTIMADLDPVSGYHHLPLNVLTLQGTTDLLAQIWEREVALALARPIYTHTGGNPFYIETVARSMVDDGLVRLEPEAPLPAPGDIQLPENLRDLIWRRLHHLSPDTLTLLRQASVLGPHFTFAQLCEMSGQLERKVLEHLDTALERRLVREISNRGALGFHHSEIHAVLYRDLGPTRRKRLHRDAAATIERLSGESSAYAAAELALHYDEAGMFTKAFDCSVLAARRAAAICVNEVALNWYRRVIDLVDLIDPSDAAERYQTLLAVYQELSETLRLVGRWDEALQVYQQGISLAQDLNDEITEAHFQDRIGELLVRQGIYDEAAFWLDHALNAFERLGDRPGIASIFRSQGMRASAVGEYQEAITLYERSLALQRELGDQRRVANLLNNIAVDTQNLGRLAEARRFYEESLVILQQLGDTRDLSRIYANLGSLAILEGDYSLACEQFETGLVIARTIGDLESIAVLLHNLAIARQELAEYATANTAYLDALQLYLELSEQTALVELLGDLSGLIAREGDYERALRLAGASAAMRDTLGISLTVADQERQQRALAPAHAALGERAAELLAAGRDLGLKEAVALVNVAERAVISRA